MKRNRYYFRQTHDFIYTGSGVDFFKAFLSNIKVKKQDEDGNDILKSPDDLRKYGDAIRWASGIAGKKLPTRYYDEFDKFKSSYKKEYALAKKCG